MFSLISFIWTFFLWSVHNYLLLTRKKSILYTFSESNISSLTFGHTCFCKSNFQIIFLISTSNTHFFQLKPNIVQTGHKQSQSFEIQNEQQKVQQQLIISTIKKLVKHLLEYNICYFAWKFSVQQCRLERDSRNGIFMVC